MTFKPGELLSQLNSELGVSKVSHYTVIIPPPPGMFGGLSFSGIANAAIGLAGAKSLVVKAEAASLPGRQFATTNFTMYGTNVKMPYGVAYDNFTVTFLCSGIHLERIFFDAWQTLISDPLNNFFTYYDEYTTDIQVLKYNEGGTPTYYVSIEEAYPITIEAQELSYETDAALKLTIRFAYRRWRNLLDKALGGGLAVPNFSPDPGFGGV